MVHSMLLSLENPYVHPLSFKQPAKSISSCSSTWHISRERRYSNICVLQGVCSKTSRRAQGSLQALAPARAGQAMPALCSPREGTLLSPSNREAKASVKLAGLPRGCSLCCPKAVSGLNCTRTSDSHSSVSGDG